MGNNGILGQASKSKIETTKASEKEYISMAIYSLITKHLGNSYEITSMELQEELGNSYLVYDTNKFDVYNKNSKNLYTVLENYEIAFSGENSITTETITKNGDANTPVFLSEQGISNVKINYSEGQEISVLSSNRLDLNNSTFKMNSYNNKQKITKENNGITINSDAFDTNQNSLFAYLDVIAEFTGKLWVSCDASSTGNIQDLGMRISLNGEPQQLCRGIGILSESVDVVQGDTIRLIFYSHIGTSAANTLYYKNIMLQYETLTSYTPYIENISSISNKYTTIVLDGTEGANSYTTESTNNGGTDYRFSYNTIITDAADSILPSDNNKVANVIVNGLELRTYNECYNNLIGLGISNTGKISIYLGNDYNRTKLIEYLQSNPITIKYKSTNTEFKDIDTSSNVSTGCIITSPQEFSVTYSYINKSQTTSLVCFGDSITGMFTNETDYPSMITRSSNIQAYNVGFAGCRWTDHTSSNYMPFSMNRLVDSVCSGDFSMQEATASNCGITYVERLNTLKSIDFTKIDYVTIFYGTNDWGSNVILRSIDDTSTSEKQRTNVEDAIKYSVSKLQEKYPNLKIIVITPYWRYLNNNDSDTTPNNNGDYLHDYSNYIENIAKNELNLQTINLYEQLDINISNYLKYLPDGTHPNESLKHTIANSIENKINNY